MYSEASEAGVLKEHGRTYHIAMCSKCGASVMLTNKQRWNNNWLSELGRLLECCDNPCYYWGDFKHKFQ